MSNLFNKTRNLATRETAPYHIWLHSVLTDAGVSFEQAEAAVTRDRLVRWYQAGEPVWMAADGARDMVRGAAIAAAAAKDGLDVLRAAYRAGKAD